MFQRHSSERHRLDNSGHDIQVASECACLFSSVGTVSMFYVCISPDQNYLVYSSWSDCSRRALVVVALTCELACCA